MLRESSATHTLGGGQVLQPVAGRSAAGISKCSNASNSLWSGDVAATRLTVAWFGGFAGFTPADLVRGANVGPEQAVALIAQLTSTRQAGRDGHAGRAQSVLLHADMSMN